MTDIVDRPSGTNWTICKDPEDADKNTKGVSSKYKSGLVSTNETIIFKNTTTKTHVPKTEKRCGVFKDKYKGNFMIKLKITYVRLTNSSRVFRNMHACCSTMRLKSLRIASFYI